MDTIRKIKNAFGLLLLLLLCGACEDWLSVSPKSEVKYDDLFAHENGFKDQLTGIYSALCTKEIYGANVTFGAIDVAGQQYYMGSGQKSNKYYTIRRFEYEDAKSKAVFHEMWGHMYNTIANVNILLRGIEEHSGVLSAKNEKIYKGEALGLRALLHFDLLRMFGQSFAAGADKAAIPYVKVISKEVPALSTVREVLDFAIADLEEAAGLLEDDPVRTGESSSAFLGTRVFHFNYYAVRALLARVYLYKNDKANALKNAQEVIEAGKFPWVARELVTTSKRENRDGVFVSEGIFILNNTLLNDLVNEFLRRGMDDSENNLLFMDEDVMDGIFEKDLYGSLDWRYTYYFEEDDWDYFSSKLWQFNNTTGKKYMNRQPLLRISEMYLIAAECAPGKADAVGYFNTLRQHRGFLENNNLASTVTDGILKAEIEKEYRKEFIGEGQWFFYCKRTGREDLPDMAVPFNKSFYCFPLPDVEIEYGNRN